ncbi:MAG: DUF2085 domain-containing protein [Ignavibacterium sp.]|nr:MAG: DUF2085 domain-containing protein [Ignavibacterium sp.]
MKINNISEKEYRLFNKFSALKIIMIFLMILFCTGLLFPVISPEFNGKIYISHLLGNVFSLVCHQSEQATFHLNNLNLLVCARCLGIYFGASLLLIITMIRSFKSNFGIKPLIIFSTQMMLDAIFVRLHFYPYSKTVAFITGLLFGAVVLYYILDTIENSFFIQQDEKYKF